MAPWGVEDISTTAGIALTDYAKTMRGGREREEGRGKREEGSVQRAACSVTGGKSGKNDKGSKGGKEEARVGRCFSRSESEKPSPNRSRRVNRQRGRRPSPGIMESYSRE